MTETFRTPRNQPLTRSTSATGMLCMVIAMMLLPASDAFSKFLTAHLSPVEVTTLRLLAQGLCLLPVAVVMRHRLRGPMFSPIVALSGGLVMVTLTCLVWAFSLMPIATAITIFFVEPLILTLLAGPLLGERVGPRRLAAVGVGLAGVLIIIRPGGGLGPAALLPLLAAVTYALNMIVLRRATETRAGLTVQCGATFVAAAGMVILATGLAAAGGIDPALADLSVPGWGAVLASGAFAAGSFVLIAEAFRRAEAGLLAPFQYLEIVGATLAGYLVFAEFPDALTWLGIAVILGSGLYVFWRERAPANRAIGRKGRRRALRVRPR